MTARPDEARPLADFATATREVARSQVTRRQILGLTVRVAIIAFFTEAVAACTRPDPHASPSGPASDSCGPASTCAEKTPCGPEENDCVCIRTPEGTNNCGQRPDCESPACSTSEDCRWVGLGAFCDTLGSGCCTPDRQRCLAPCTTIEPTIELPTNTCAPCQGYVATAANGKLNLEPTDCNDDCLSTTLATTPYDTRSYPAILSSLESLGFRPKGSPSAATQFFDKDGAVLATLTVFGFVHTSDESREADLVLYTHGTTGGMPLAFIKDAEPYIVSWGTTQTLIKTTESMQEPLPTFDEGNLEVAGAVNKSCVKWCQLVIGVAAAAGCTALAAEVAILLTPTGPANPVLVKALWTACIAGAGLGQQFLCDEMCEEPAPPTPTSSPTPTPSPTSTGGYYCGCPEHEACFDSVVDCVQKCPGGLACFGYSSCAQESGKCGVP